MLDSVTLVWPIIIDPMSFRVGAWKQCSRQYGRIFQNLYEHEIGASSMRLAYDVGRSELVLGPGSLPRVLYGHNACLLSEHEITPTIEKLECAMWDRLKRVNVPPHEVPTLWDWAVRKIDIAFDFTPSLVSAAAALEAFGSLQPTRKMIAHKIGTTVYFRADSPRFHNELRIYDKYAEALQTYGPKVADLAKDTIRFEFSLRDQATIRRTLGLKDNPLSAIAVKALLYNALRQKLAQLHVAEGLSTVSVGMDNLSEMFGPRRGRTLWHYREDRKAWTDAQIARKYGITRETVCGYSRDLRDAGFFPASVPAAGVFEELLSALDDDMKAPAEPPAVLEPEPASAA